MIDVSSIMYRIDTQLDRSKILKSPTPTQALMNMDSAPTTGFEKLQFLLQQNECPPETFGNLLLLYVKHQYFDQAADVMAENTHLTFK